MSYSFLVIIFVTRRGSALETLVSCAEHGLEWRSGVKLNIEHVLVTMQFNDRLAYFNELPDAFYSCPLSSNMLFENLFTVHGCLTVAALFL